MDVEKIQKINNLALELIRQGLVQDKEEAVRQAERVFAQQDYSSLRETMTGEKEIMAGAGKEEKTGQEELKGVVEKNTAFLVGKMKEYQEQIDSLRKEIISLRNEMAGMRGKVDGLKVATEAKRGEPQQRLEAERGSAGKSSGSSGHPRSGNYNENDVSIEKFFYAGKK